MKAILVIVALLVAIVAQVQAKPEKPENSAICTICTFVTNVVEEYLQNNATLAKIEQALGKVCNLFGSYQAECQDFVNSEVPAIVQLLLNKESPQVICTQLHACTSKFAEKPKIKPIEVIPKPQQGGALCSICEIVIQTVESYLAANATQQEIIAGLENFCNALPGSISATCDAIVEQYTPMAIQWLLNNESPQTFCTQISLCSSARLPAQGVRPKPAQGGGACGLCELAIASVEQYLQQNQTEAQIIAFLENICNSLPGGVGSICDSLVDQYVPLMINWLVQNEPPQVFCTQIGFCSSATAQMLPLRRTNARPLTRLTRPYRR